MTTGAANEEDVVEDDDNDDDNDDDHQQQQQQSMQQRRSIRRASTPERFVARPSQRGLGAKEGDMVFLASGHRFGRSIATAAGNVVSAIFGRRNNADATAADDNDNDNDNTATATANSTNNSDSDRNRRDDEKGDPSSSKSSNPSSNPSSSSSSSILIDNNNNNKKSSPPTITLSSGVQLQLFDAPWKKISGDDNLYCRVVKCHQQIQNQQSEGFCKRHYALCCSCSSSAGNKNVDNDVSSNVKEEDREEQEEQQSSTTPQDIINNNSNNKNNGNSNGKSSNSNGKSKNNNNNKSNPSMTSSISINNNGSSKSNTNNSNSSNNKSFPYILNTGVQLQIFNAPWKKISGDDHLYCRVAGCFKRVKTSGTSSTSTADDDDYEGFCERHYPLCSSALASANTSASLPQQQTTCSSSPASSPCRSLRSQRASQISHNIQNAISRRRQQPSNAAAAATAAAIAMNAKTGRATRATRATSRIETTTVKDDDDDEEEEDVLVIDLVTKSNEEKQGKGKHDNRANPLSSKASFAPRTTRSRGTRKIVELSDSNSCDSKTIDISGDNDGSTNNDEQDTTTLANNMTKEKQGHYSADSASSTVNTSNSTPRKKRGRSPKIKEETEREEEKDEGESNVALKSASLTPNKRSRGGEQGELTNSAGNEHDNDNETSRKSPHKGDTPSYSTSPLVRNHGSSKSPGFSPVRRSSRPPVASPKVRALQQRIASPEDVESKGSSTLPVSKTIVNATSAAVSLLKKERVVSGRNSTATSRKSNEANATNDGRYKKYDDIIDLTDDVAKECTGAGNEKEKKDEEEVSSEQLRSDQRQPIDDSSASLKQTTVLAKTILLPQTLKMKQPIVIGCLVCVQPRTWPGINKPGGVARIVNVLSTTDNGVSCTKYDVAYVVGGGREKGVDAQFVSLLPDKSSIKRKRADDKKQPSVDMHGTANKSHDTNVNDLNANGEALITISKQPPKKVQAVSNQRVTSATSAQSMNKSKMYHRCTNCGDFVSPAPQCSTCRHYHHKEEQTGKKRINKDKPSTSASVISSYHMTVTRHELLRGRNFWMCEHCNIGIPSLTMPCGMCRRTISVVPLEKREFETFIQKHELSKRKRMLPDQHFQQREKHFDDDCLNGGRGKKLTYDIPQTFNVLGKYSGDNVNGSSNDEWTCQCGEACRKKRCGKCFRWKGGTQFPQKGLSPDVRVQILDGTRKGISGKPLCRVVDCTKGRQSGNDGFCRQHFLLYSSKFVDHRKGISGTPLCRVVECTKYPQSGNDGFCRKHFLSYSSKFADH